jgi:hypothetical protein
VTITLAEIKVEGSSYLQSLLKLVGDKKVADILGYISDAYGGGPAFKLAYIVFEDGSKMGVEGEHDYPYATMFSKWPQPNYDEETLQRLYDESNQ